MFSPVSHIRDIEYTVTGHTKNKKVEICYLTLILWRKIKNDHAPGNLGLGIEDFGYFLKVFHWILPHSKIKFLGRFMKYILSIKQPKINYKQHASNNHHFWIFLHKINCVAEYQCRRAYLLPLLVLDFGMILAGASLRSAPTRNCKK